jgi:nucleoside-diphosphate-sugar epimerase
MRIVVTGGSGLVGRGVVALLSREHAVLNLDLKPPDATSTAEFVSADVRDDSALLEAFQGADAVVHAAGIPGPTFGTESETQEINVGGTRNVGLAAAGAGVPRVVFISSESVLGLVFGGGAVRPRYLPIDERHPLAPTEHYGRSKLMAEAELTKVAGDALTVLSLRPPWVWAPEEYEKLRQLTERPEDWWDGLWAYVHRDDLARAVSLGLTCALDAGFHAAYLAAPDNGTIFPTRELVDRFYPGTDVADDITTYGSLISSRGARAMLGFEPRMSWREFLS